ncbi:MAG TPA: hypothetical protein VMV17_08950, partial [Streptosporangiaceae bacterium]|nr:hypothetical protein [Streptosporangiaceae bacterium]
MLIVENLGTDGSWVKFIISKLRPKLNFYLREPHPGLQILNAGGNGEIPKELERVTALYLRARPSEAMPLRVIAMTDSD